VLSAANLDPSFAIGGYLQREGTNARWGRGSYFVAEADESDGSFLRLRAFGAIVTNLEAEHLDYWKSLDRLVEGFSRFFAKFSDPAHLFWGKDDPHLDSLHPPGYSYGFSAKADLQIVAWEPTATGSRFSFTFQGKTYAEVSLSLWGRHNVLNAAAVFGLALTLQIPESIIRDTLASFQGTKRRLEWRGEVRRLQLFDDYGHHPSEIAATLAALRTRFPERRLIAIFQPHRYSRVRDLCEEFCRSFDAADLVILTDIDPAGEVAIQGISTEMLYEKMRGVYHNLVRMPRVGLESHLAHIVRPLDVLLLLGAGDITKAADPILRALEAQMPRYRVALLCGGISPEREISLRSARNIARVLDPHAYELQFFVLTSQGHWVLTPDTTAFESAMQCAESELFSSSILQALQRSDIAIPVFHGPKGEDGMIQGFLETLQIPYVGCGYQSSALCMHKGWTKQVALLSGVPTAPFVEIDIVSYRNSVHSLEEKMLQASLCYPVWVKAVHLGSSIGVSRVACREELSAAVAEAFAVDDLLIVEQEIQGRQIEFAVLGNDMLRVALPCEILTHGLFYDYERKYGPNALGVAIPADLTPTQQRLGADLARTVYRALDCKGLARIDFFLDTQGHFWLNEVNPFPGFVDTSAYPKMWEATHLTPTRLLDELLALALHRTRRRAAQRV
jgi:UDP-N-acetylmuramate--alanine ligase